MITERERERQISQLRTRIAELEAIANRTSAQEQELQAKRAELARLENQQQGGGGSSGGNPKKPTNYWMWILVVVVFLVIVIVAYFIIRKKKVNISKK